MSERQNKFEKDGKRVRNDIFNSLGHSMTSSGFYELQTCRDKTKYMKKLLFCLNPFLKLLCVYLKWLQQQVLIISLMLWK